MRIYHYLQASLAVMTALLVVATLLDAPSNVMIFAAGLVLVVATLEIWRLSVLKVWPIKRYVVALALFFVGCSETPNEQYKLDASLYNGASIGLNVAHTAGKINDPSWAKIAPIMAEAKSHLADAYAWLQANPALANVPGYSLPALDPAGVAIGVLLGYAGQFDLVPITPPASPTQP